MITLDGWGILALMFFGFLIFNSAILAFTAWRRGRDPEYRALQARRQYLQALPRDEWRTASDVHIPPCPRCGRLHRQWEYCPKAPARVVGVTIDGDGG